MIDAFYSDPHFGHQFVAEHRSFESVEKMNEELVLRYNSIVGVNDLVLWLGDCFFAPVADARRLMDRLNGRKILVRGNHDGSPRRMASLGFAVVADELFLCLAGRKVRASHYPYAKTGAEAHRSAKDRDRFLERRPPRIKGEVLLHGHCHSNRRKFENMIHVGVDAWSFAPAPRHEVEQLIREIGGSQ